MHIAKKILFGALWIPALYSSCALDGTETTNGIVVCVVDDTVRGTSSDRAAMVILCDARHFPGFTGGLLDTLRLDDKGGFFLEKVPEGVYNVYAYPPQACHGAAVQTVPVKMGAVFSDTAKFDSLNTIAGLVRFEGKIQKEALVYIAGSPFQTKSDTNGIFVFDKIPDGEYAVIGKLATLGSWKDPSDTVKVQFSSESHGIAPGASFDTLELK